MDEFTKEIKGLISQNKVKEAIDLLLKYSNSKSEDFKNAAIELSAQYNSWKNRDVLDLAKERDLTKIRVSILDLLPSESTKKSENVKSALLKNTSLPKKKYNLKFIIWGVVAVIFIVLSVIVVRESNLFELDSVKDFEVFDDKILSKDSTRLLEVKDYIKYDIDGDQMKFTFSGDGLNENDGTSFRYLTKQIGDNWGDYDTHQGYKEKIYYGDSSSWYLFFWHSLKELKNGEEFKIMLFENEVDTSPFLVYVFKVKYEKYRGAAPNKD